MVFGIKLDLLNTLCEQKRVKSNKFSVSTFRDRGNETKLMKKQELLWQTCFRQNQFYFFYVFKKNNCRLKFYTKYFN